MEGQIYTANEIREKLQPVFHSSQVEKAILFGSFAKGNQTALSDADIFIDSKGKLQGIDFFGILGDITDILKIPVDLIEACEVIEGGKIEQEIFDTGVVIYERI
ncbi:MAG: nucleotidyltransferase domain-containing protein [Oscillospiraceae bacterium]|nr:nucleotidyltransferase domain-containing protein [Oscillospiraceae bacterium]